MTVSEFKERELFCGGCDREIGEWRIIDVHDLTFPAYTEADFYCCNSKVAILLRVVIKKQEKRLTIVPDIRLTYWVAEVETDTIDNTLLEELLAEFSNLE